MKKIRKNKMFKLVSWLLIFLFIFQADYLISKEKKSDAEVQLEKACEEIKNGQKEIAKKRLERLIEFLNPEKNNSILKEANELLKKIQQPGTVICIPGKPPKKKFPWLLVAGGAVAAFLIWVLLINKKTPKYTLSVTKEEGIEGYPESGTHTYKKGETVNYNYTSQQGYTALTVTLDGSVFPNSGPITMDRNHTLVATTTKLVNVHIESEPTGADVFIDGVNQGIPTPCDLTILPGNREIRLVEATWGEAKSSINFEENTNYNLNVTLSGYTYEFETKWGSEGDGDGQFRRATGIALDKNNYVYVVDYFNHRIQKFDSNGKFISKWGNFGSDNRQFWSPCGIAVDENNYVYVADSDNERIQKFDSNGIFILKWGSYGNGNGQFNWPFDIAIDKNNYVYVSEYNNHRIQKFDSNGVFILKWGSEGIDNGQFSFPRGIAVDNNGNVYVADIWNHRIQKFDSNGNLLIVWGSYGSGAGQFYLPMYIAVDRNNYVYVSDYNNQRIQKFDSNGIFISKWGSYGNGNGQFLSPYGIAVGEEGYIYVSEYNNHRIQKFRMSDQTEDDGEWTINSTATASSKLSITPSLSEKKNPDKKKQSQNFKTWKER